MGELPNGQGSAFIGIGTGRCGTVSLARIIDVCANTMVGHENPAFGSPWERRDEAAMEEFVRYARWGIANGLCVGDVALYWLPHVDRLREALPGLRVICLQRDRDATIASYLRKCPGYTLVRPRDRERNPEWWDLLPTVDGATLEEAWGRYYDLYYKQAARLPDMLWVRTEEFKDDEALTRIFDHLGIPTADRVYPARRRYNTSEETVVSVPRS